MARMGIGSHNDDMETFTLIFVAVHDRSIQFEDGKGQNYWLPISEIECDQDHDPGDKVDVLMPKWLAKSRGLS